MPKPRFKLSAGLNLETFDTILSGTNHLSRGLNLNCRSNSLNSATGLLKSCLVNQGQSPRETLKFSILN